MISELQNYYLLLSIIYTRWSVLYKYVCCNSLYTRIGFGKSMGLNPDQVKYTIKLVCIASFQRLVGSKAKQYVREGWHVYPQIGVSVN
jgi:hypothetical protein